MKSNIARDSFAFCRNPIFMRNDFVPEDYNPMRGARLNVYSPSMPGTYKARYTPPLDMNVSEVVAPYCPDYPEPSGAEVITRIEDGFDSRRFTVSLTDDWLDEYDFIALPGGISKQNFRAMQQIGSDIFSERFLREDRQFFLTARTPKHQIEIPETELYPLYFIRKGVGPWYMTIEEAVSKHKIEYDGNYEDGVFALNIDAARKHFFDEFSVFASVFDIYTGVNQAHACRIIIKQAALAKNRCRIKFRNSFGVFELVELTGIITITPDYERADETYFLHDAVIDDFYVTRDRIERKQVIELQTGVKMPDDVRFMMDMLCSDEVYLLDVYQYPIKVVPTTENFAYKWRADVPEQFTVKLQVSESEKYIMHDIVDGSEGSMPHIFSRQFTNHFN